MRLLWGFMLLCALLGPAGNAFAQAPVEVPVTPPTWGADTTFEFGIYENGQRVASAYYRILKEKAVDRDVYRFKYVGRNPRISEATECVVDAADLRPLRSTRKVVYDGKTFYQDTGYREGGVLLRRRFDGQAATEKPVAARSELYDYEQLLWLIPQLQLPDAGKARFELFSMLSESAGTVIVSAEGYEDVTIQGKSYNARVYTFDVGMTPYKYWMVMQAGHGVPGRVDMANTRFENLKLDPRKVTQFPRYEAAAPAEQRTFGRDDDDSDGETDDSIEPFIPPPPQNP